MPCFHPLKAYRSAEVGSSGKRQVTFNALKAHEGTAFELPCGQCQGCRMDRSQQWAMRCVHEAKISEASCFGTFTYSDEAVPQSFSLVKRDFQGFMKRLREHLWRIGRQKVRFLAAGEYGDGLGRPHYHALLFGFDPSDKTEWRKSEQGHWLYRSELLEKLWPHGHVEVGAVTFQSAAYVARYCFKKVNGDRALDHYARVSPIDGRLYQVEPEFQLMSLKPGIGQAWFDRFWRDAFPSDFLVVDGRKVPVPPFYMRLYQRKLEAERVAAGVVPDRYRLSGRADDAERVKRARRRRAVEPKAKANRTPDRLAVREEVLEHRLKRLVREVE